MSDALGTDTRTGVGQNQNKNSKAKTWACRSCQARKIKCDGAKPSCSTCIAHIRECFYDPTGPKPRSRVPGSRRYTLERRKILQPGSAEQNISQPYNTSTPARSSPGNQSPRNDTLIRDQGLNEPARNHISPGNHSNQSPGNGTLIRDQRLDEPTRNPVSPGPSEDIPDLQRPDQVSFDLTSHLGIDQSGDIEVRGPTNTLYETDEGRLSYEEEVPDTFASAILTANAATERQKEAENREILLARGEIEGISAELALHLLDIHWSRHHFFLVTYRPAFYRDMMTGGKYYSKLLFFAMMAVSSRYSERLEVGGGDHSANSGSYFYQRAKELLTDEMEKSTIPTATALLLLGNALVSAGEIDRGWLYTGMGIRMIINLGLHLQVNQAPKMKRKQNLEDIEIRKRLFWGAYVSEKLQSLYLGRPFVIHEKDVHVEKNFLDIYEEHESWSPVPNQGTIAYMQANSVTSFIWQCKLSEICEAIMSSFYAVKAKMRPSTDLHQSREEIRKKLTSWITDLPQKLRFTPWSIEGQPLVPIHVIVLHTIYFSLVILLERPFVENGHLISNAESLGSWSNCTVAAEKIAYLLKAYRNSYTFRRVPYQLCYATYVASTIFVRNAKNMAGQSRSVQHLEICLKAFEEMKITHPGTARMEVVIRSLMRQLSVNVDFYDLSMPDSVPTTNPPQQLRNIPNLPLTKTQPATTTSYMESGVPALAENSNTGVRNAPYISTSLNGMSYDEVNNFEGFNWDFFHKGINDDLLFGISEDANL